METPVLTAKQQKQTLSTKKGKTRLTVKNIVNSPYNSFWPKLSDEDGKKLLLTLKESLPKLRDSQLRVPWNLVKSVPKESRKEFRKKYCEDNGGAVVNKGNGIVFGVNNVSKLLESNNAACVLISGEVEPRFMVQHLIDQCLLNGVDVLVVDCLKETLGAICGIKGVTVGFSKDTSYENLVTAVKKLNTFSVPTNHLHSQRLSSKFDDTRESPKQDTIKKKTTIDTKAIEQLKKVLYLKRESKETRIFIPGESQSCKAMEIAESGFLGFEPETEKTIYKPLVVKRVKGDINRNKRKLKHIKNRENK